MLWARILSIISPVVIGFLAASLFYYESKFYYFLFGCLAFAGITIFLLIKNSRDSKHLKNSFYYLSTGIFLILGHFTLLLLLENIWLKIVLVLLLFLAVLFYYNNLFKKLYRLSLIEQQKEVFYYKLLEGLIVFLLFTTLFGFKEFLNYPIVWTLFLVVAVLFILFINYNFFQARKGLNPLIFLFISILVFVEIFWALTSLSLVYYIKGFLFSVVYLIYTLLRSLYFQEETEKKVLKTYFIFIIIVTILILSTARWF